MIQNWYEPANFSEWFKRAFSLINIIAIVVTATLFFSEFRFDWVEIVVGHYLVSTNEARPETGAIWETGRQTSNALERLNQMVTAQENVRQTTQQADSFYNLASSLKPGQWVTLEKQQFKTLYLNLEKTAAVHLLEPVQLVWLLNGKDLERIFCEGVADGIIIYFIDGNNRVIQQVALKVSEIEKLEKSERAIKGTLSDMDAFSGRIFPAPYFFNALSGLPKDILPDLIPSPEILLAQTGQLTRVGIWNEASDGYILLGFEFKQGNDTQVVLLKGREWAVWQLSLNLKSGSQ
jgi:hypothetical protein